ncbi:hypothetical protein SJ921_14750, partial [Enterococcus faecium]
LPQLYIFITFLSLKKLYRLSFKSWLLHRCYSAGFIKQYGTADRSCVHFSPVWSISVYYRIDPSCIDSLADGFTEFLRLTLDAVAPLRRKVVNPRKSAPWFNAEMRSLKQKCRKLERKWRSTSLKESLLAWKDSLTTYKRALWKAKKTYYSSLIRENQNNHRFLFSTVARLTQSHSSIESRIPTHLTANDFMSFFISKIVNIRDRS